MNAPYLHVPVLPKEIIEGLAPQSGGLYLDATVGGGGHSALILEVSGTRVVALDQDAQAIAAAKVRLQPYRDRITFWQGNFADYESEQKFDGIIADLGVSSAQLDQPERGFSFRHAAPLDMRMNQAQSLTAADLINTSDERELADIFYHYGEERLSRRIARHIVATRPFETTTELASAVARVMPRHKSGRTRGMPIHPATRVFQALRIAVNSELSSIETFLAKAPLWLRPNGRLCVISFHSLEDRITKHTLRATECLKVLTSKPIYAQSEELDQNPRSRSAKLRIAERI